MHWSGASNAWQCKESRFLCMLFVWAMCMCMHVEFASASSGLRHACACVRQRQSSRVIRGWFGLGRQGAAQAWPAQGCERGALDAPNDRQPLRIDDASESFSTRAT